MERNVFTALTVTLFVHVLDEVSIIYSSIQLRQLVQMACLLSSCPWLEYLVQLPNLVRDLLSSVFGFV